MSKPVSHPPLLGGGLVLHNETLAFRTLLAVAHQRNGLNEAGCRLILELLSAGSMVQGALRRVLSEINLSELKFGVLVVLFTTDPSPSTPTDLALHTSVTRSAVTDALDGLEQHGLAVRERDTKDRRIILIRLTDLGRTTVDSAIMKVLQAAGSIAQKIKPNTHSEMLNACAALSEGAAKISS